MFRISMAGGLGQDTIKTMSAVLDVPDINISLSDVVIDIAGTYLPLGQTVNAIKNIQLTIQDDGNLGVSAKILDKQTALVQVIDKNGNAHQGLVDAVIQAY